jgi:DNA-binding LacI/PurR family transcriptional regulator
MKKTIGKRPAKHQPVSASERMRAYRARMRAQGLKLVQIWAYDTKSPEFIAEARRQCLAIANKTDPDGEEIMKFIEATYEWPEYEWPKK